MGTLQTPNPTFYPNRSPITNSHPNPNPNSVPDAKSPSYDDVSKFFSLPLSDAADSLACGPLMVLGGLSGRGLESLMYTSNLCAKKGVCPSVLKKLCYENGLVRWPYRQFLSGKSIEEIKKDAAIEKSKQLVELPNVAGPKNDALSSSPISSSIVSQLQNKSAGAQQEMPKFRTEISQNLHSSTMTKWNLDSLDEFKYGFPSSLSTVTHRWWGNTSSNSNGVDGPKNDNEDTNESNQQSKEDLAQKNDNEDAYESNQRSKEDLADDAVNLSSKDGEMSESKTNEADTQWTHLLSTLRKKAVKEGNQALKLGVYRGYGVNKLDQSKKMVLHQIFKSSLPSQWKDLSF